MEIVYYGIALIWFYVRHVVKTSIPLPYGKNNGDKAIGYGDDTAKKITLQDTIRIYDKEFKSFYISFNGGIFQTRYTRIALDDLWTDFPEYSLLPYWADANFLGCNDCNVFYRHNINADNLNQINTLVKRFYVFEDDFNFQALPKKTLVVTWAGAPSYRHRGDFRNSFQLILTSDGIDTYAIFGYEDIQYPRLDDIHPKIGYFISGSTFCGLQRSDYENLSELPCKSNVYTPGVFVLHLTPTQNTICEGGIFMPTCINCGTSATTYCTEDDIKEKYEVCTTNNLKFENKCNFKKELCITRASFSSKKCEDNGGVCGDIGECHEKAVCRHTPSGQYRCECLPGYGGDGKNCLDINECATSPCQNNQVCEDLVNDYLCKCQSPWTGRNCELFAPCEENNGGCEETCGYDSNLDKQCSCVGKPLNADKKTCAKGSFAIVGLTGYIFYDNINIQNVHELPIEGQDIKLQNIRVTGLDIDYVNDVIYFMDSASFSIMKVNRDGNGLEVLLQGRKESETFDDLAYDSIGEYLFWSEGKSVFRYSLQTSQITEVVKSENKIRAILLLKEDCKRRVYWAESELPTPGIRYKNMDNPSGSQPVTIVSEWVYVPQGMSADHEEQKIYWIDNFFHRIESANYDGSCRKLLTESLPNNVFSLSYYDNALYFSHWGSFSLRKYDLSDGKNETLAVYVSRSFGVKIYNPSQTYSCKNTFKCVSDEQPKCNHETCIHGSCSKTDQCVCNIGFKGSSCSIKDDTFTFSRLHINFESTEIINSTLKNSEDSTLSTFIHTVSNTSVTSSYIMQRETGIYMSALYLQSRDTKLDNILQIVQIKHDLDSRYAFLSTNKMTNVIGNQVKCIPQELKEPFTDIPFVLIQQESHSLTSPTWHLQIWLRDISKERFTICFQEIINFSGLKNVSLHYLAITKQSNVFNEISSYVPEQNIYESAVTYCHAQSFENSYKRPPFVFLSTEVSSNTARVMSWISNITETNFQICYQSLNALEESEILKINYAVKAADDPCENKTCSNLQFCYEDEFGIGECMCRQECDDEEEEPVCSSFGITYKNMCDFTRMVCENGESDENIIYNGKCQDFAYEHGKTALEVDPEIPVAFCNYVTVNTSRFKATVPLRVQLAVSWNDAQNENMVTSHDASASWVEQITHEDFRACVVVSGRNYNEDFPPPSINWFAYQVLGDGFVKVGTVAMETWYSGSRCSLLSGVENHDGSNSTILLSVEHSQDRMIENAVTSWVEVSESSGTSMYRICARELQNFDGKHEGLKMHWVILTKESTKENVILGEESVSMDPKYMGAPRCKKIAFNKILTKIPHIHLTAILEIPIEKFRANIEVSDNDAAVWIEKATMTYFELCCKSLRSSLFEHQLKVNYAVFTE